MKRGLLIAGICVILAAVLWAAIEINTVAHQIQAQAALDETTPSDVIIVLGAAEYSGRPSPVLTRRLNHALFLYLQELAPYILTTGGAGGDPTFTEGEVAHNYLSRHGVPSEAILVESEGESTVHSITAAAEIMQRMKLTSCIVVSDGYHIYRVKKMLESRGLRVHGSPRPEERPANENSWKQYWVYTRQAIAYELWRIGIPV
ncbi:MAG: YdcF family protein [Acidobacteriota bacterium]